MRWCVKRWPGATIGGHSLSQPLRAASSLREGAGNGCPPFSVPPGNRGGAGDFHRPKLKSFLHSTIHRGTLPQSRFRSTAPSGREPGMGLCHSTCRPETVGVRAIFIAPTKLREFYISPLNRVLAKTEGWRAIFIAPTKAQNVLHSTTHWGGCKIRKKAILGKMALGGVIFPELPGRKRSRRF